MGLIVTDQYSSAAIAAGACKAPADGTPFEKLTFKELLWYEKNCPAEAVQASRLIADQNAARIISGIPSLSLLCSGDGSGDGDGYGDGDGDGSGYGDGDGDGYGDGSGDGYGYGYGSGYGYGDGDGDGYGSGYGSGRM